MSSKACGERVIDAVTTRLCDDSMRAYRELEPRPCRRACAMLFQWVPVLVILFLFAYYTIDSQSHVEIFSGAPYVLVIVGLIGTGTLLFYVVSDIVSACATTVTDSHYDV